LSERANESGPVLPVIKEVLSPSDPVAGCEAWQQCLVETARRLGIEILDGRVLPEVGKFEPGGRADQTGRPDRVKKFGRSLVGESCL
jgi:hypothetical protein